MGRAWKTVLGLLAAVLAPLAAAWNRLAKERPGVALLIALVWLAVVAAGWLVWRLVGPSVDAALDARGRSLWAIVDRAMSSYGRQYRAWAQEHRSKLDLGGAVTVGPATPDLDDVFVNLVLDSRSPGQVPTGVVSSAGTPVRKLEIWHFLNRRDRVVLVVLGAPGSGKTTLLSHVVRETVATYRLRLRSVPVMLKLSDHAAAVAADPAITLPTLIRRTVSEELNSKEPSGWWENRLRTGKCVVLLDGLDEVASAGERRAVVTWVNRQVGNYPRDHFVVTSRPHGYRDERVKADDTVRVLPFDQEQIRRFLRRWYRAAGNANEPAADELIDQLDAVPGLRDLATSPLLLSMIADVHLYRKRLPENRAVLYREVCEVMLWRRDQQKGRRLDLPGPQRLAVLARLAFEWMCSGTRVLDRRDLLDTLRPWLAGNDPGTFLGEMEGAGLLQGARWEEFGFVHQTFQEYLAARHIRESRRVEVLVDAVDDPWWRETAVLYAADNDPDPIVEAALSSGSDQAMSLAFEIAAAKDNRVSPVLQDRLNQLLREGSHPAADPGARRIAVDALVGQLLRTTTLTRTGARITREPVSVELYRLFLADAGAPSPDGPESGEPDSPARGMRASDALAFLKWINESVAAGPRAASGIVFRLPSTAELTELAPSRPAWADRKGRPESWCQGKRSDTVTADELVAAMTADLSGSALLRAIQARVALALGDELRASAGAVHALANDLLGMVLSSRVPMSRGNASPTDFHDASWSARLQAAAQKLQVRAELLQRVAEDIQLALRQLPQSDRPVAAKLTSICEGLAVDKALRTISAAVWNNARGVGFSVRETEIALTETGKVAKSIVAMLSRPGPAGLPQTPSDRMLQAIAEVVTPVVVKERLGGEPAAAVAAALIPQGLRRAGFLAVDLEMVATFVRRTPDPAIAQRLTAMGFARLLADLFEAAEPSVLHRRPITADSAAAVRAPALAVARVAEELESKRLTADLIRLAAATCLLEKRSSSPDLLETLVLAHD